MNPEEPISEIDPPPKRRTRLQFRLGTILLIIAVVAVWGAYIRTWNEIHSLESYVPTLTDFDRRLHVVDPQQFAIVNTDYYSVEDRYRIFLPPGGKYRLCITGRPPADPNDRLADLQEEASQEIMPGEYTLQLRTVTRSESPTPRWIVAPQLDRKDLFQYWLPYHPPGSYSEVDFNKVRASRQTPTDQPLMVIDKVFPAYDGSPGFVDSKRALRLWIEKID